MRVGIDVRPMLEEKAGIGYYVWGLLTGLAKVDSKNHYVLFANRYFEFREQENFEKKIITSPLWHVQASRAVKKMNLDVYHSTHSLIIPSFLNRPTVLTFHDASAFKVKETQTLKVKLITNSLLKMAAQKAKKIIVPSLSSEKDLLKLVGIKKEKITVIAEAVDEGFSKTDKKQIDEIKKRYSLPEKYILFNATLEPRKNVKRLIKAFQEIKKEIKQDLVLAGKIGWGMKREEVKGERVHYLGWVPDLDLPALYSGADLFVYPSLYEGFGLSILKAFKAEVPVLTSNLSSLPEVAGDAALLVDPLDTSAIAQGMKKILTNESFFEKLKTAGLRRVKDFTWEKTALQTLKVYESLIE